MSGSMLNLYTERVEDGLIIEIGPEYALRVDLPDGAVVTNGPEFDEYTQMAEVEFKHGPDAHSSKVTIAAAISDCGLAEASRYVFRRRADLCFLSPPEQENVYIIASDTMDGYFIVPNAPMPIPYWGKWPQIVVIGIAVPLTDEKSIFAKINIYTYAQNDQIIADVLGMVHYASACIFRLDE